MLNDMEMGNQCLFRDTADFSHLFSSSKYMICNILELEFCHYTCIFANILYLILLIQSITIILRIFMFYKQCILAELLGRKDSAVGINKLFIAHSTCTTQWYMHRCAWDWHYRALFGSQNAIFVKHKYTWECWLIMFRIRVCVRYPI